MLSDKFESNVLDPCAKQFKFPNQFRMTNGNISSLMHCNFVISMLAPVTGNG